MKRLQKYGMLTAASLLMVQLAACGSSNNSGDSASPAASGSASASASASTTDSQEQVTLRIMDWSDSMKATREEFNKQFMEKYPNIKIEYTVVTLDQFKNTILTAVNTGDAPDLFPVPSGMKLSTVVQDGWFQPMDPYIDQEFKDMFVDGTFLEGTTMVDGKIYSIPETASYPHTMVFYNKKLFEAAGLDPEKPPVTYSEYREAAKKITEAGKGQFYGVIEGGKQSARWGFTVKDWASLAGEGLNPNSPINLATGKPTYDSQAVQDLFGLFEGLRDDGSFYPDTMNITAPEARALFGQGKAAFLAQGSWCIPVWNHDNPDLDYGVMAPPVPDTGRKGSIGITNNLPWVGLSAQTKHPKEAILYLKEYYGGDYFQKELVSSGTGFSVVKGVNEQYSATSAQLKQYYDLIQEYGRMAPDPSVGNPEVASVFAEYKDVHPDIGELLGGTVAGSIKDVPKALTQYSSQVDKAWTAAVEAAKGKGSNVDAADFVFSNWDPMKNYTAEDYQALKK